jgi:hypothetical protein
MHILAPDPNLLASESIPTTALEEKKEKKEIYSNHYA